MYVKLAVKGACVDRSEHGAQTSDGCISNCSDVLHQVCHTIWHLGKCEIIANIITRQPRCNNEAEGALASDAACLSGDRDKAVAIRPLGRRSLAILALAQIPVTVFNMLSAWS